MSSGVSSTSTVLLYFLAIFIPPIPVFMKRGCRADFFINICLTILGWIPGCIHAWWLISKYSTPKAASVKSARSHGTTTSARPIGNGPVGHGHAGHAGPGMTQRRY